MKRLFTITVFLFALCGNLYMQGEATGFTNENGVDFNYQSNWNDVGCDPQFRAGEWKDILPGDPSSEDCDCPIGEAYGFLLVTAFLYTLIKRVYRKKEAIPPA